MKKKYLEYGSAALLILFGVWGWYETSTWKVASGGELAPTTYPRILFTAILCFGVFILGRTLVKEYVTKKGAEALNVKVDMHLLGVIETVAALLLYILAMQYVGFLIATPIYLFVSMLIFGERKWLRMAVISAVGSVVLYLFFVRLLGVQF